MMARACRPRLMSGDVQGKRVVAVAAAKRHTVVLTAEGDVHTWGHRVVTPRRVQLAGAREAVHMAMKSLAAVACLQ